MADTFFGEPNNFAQAEIDRQNLQSEQTPGVVNTPQEVVEPDTPACAGTAYFYR